MRCDVSMYDSKVNSGFCFNGFEWVCLYNLRRVIGLFYNNDFYSVSECGNCKCLLGSVLKYLK